MQIKSPRMMIIIGVVMTFAIYGLTYVSALSSDSYEEAKRFVRSQKAIEVEIGGVKSVFLSPLGYQMRRTGREGSAQYSLRVIGDHGQLGVRVTLNYRTERWVVIRAEVDGNVISID